MVDHASELTVVLTDPFVFDDFVVIFDNLQWFHVEVVLKGEVDIHLTGSDE